MDNHKNILTVNKLLYVSLIVLIFSVTILILKNIGVGTLVLKVIKSFIPVFIAVFISFLLEPVISFFMKKGMSRRVSVLIVYFLFVAIVAFIVYFTLPILINQIRNLIDNLPAFVSMIANVVNKIGINVNDGQFTSFIMNVSNAFIKSIGSVANILYIIALALSGALFLSFDFIKFKESVRTKIPKILKKPIIYYFQNFLPFVHRYFLGMLIDSIIIFIISLIGLTIIDLDYALVLSIFIALTNLIPIIGPYIGGIPAVIVGFSISSTIGISALIVVILVQLIESNFIQPLILKNVISLHPLEGILGISLFGALFGVIGMILSPILIVGIKLLFSPYDNEIEEKIKI